MMSDSFASLPVHIAPALQVAAVLCTLPACFSTTFFSPEDLMVLVEMSSGCKIKVYF